MSLDFTKTIKTDDGRAVRILCTDAPEPFPVVALIEGRKWPCVYTLDGKPGRSGDPELVEAPTLVEHTVWIALGKQDMPFGSARKLESIQKAYPQATEYREVKWEYAL